jgi:hypothetical protein
MERAPAPQAVVPPQLYPRHLPCKVLEPLRRPGRRQRLIRLLWRRAVLVCRLLSTTAPCSARCLPGPAFLRVDGGSRHLQQPVAHGRHRPRRRRGLCGTRGVARVVAGSVRDGVGCGVGGGVDGGDEAAGEGARGAGVSSQGQGREGSHATHPIQRCKGAKL